MYLPVSKFQCFSVTNVTLNFKSESDSLTKAGLVEDKAVLRLETGRLVSRDECFLLHRDKFWSNWTHSESLSEEERETWAKTRNNIYLNQDSMRCASLSVGGVLQCVDSVMAGQNIFTGNRWQLFCSWRFLENVAKHGNMAKINSI